jgi:heat shock protein HslJ
MRAAQDKDRPMKSAAMKLAAIVGLLILTASPTIAGAAGLEGSEWRPISRARETLPAKPALFIRFDAKGRLAGYGGCNHFFGGYETHGERIKISAIGMSMMACEPPIAEREAQFVKALEAARLFRRNRNRLTFFAAAGKAPLLRLVQTDSD